MVEEVEAVEAVTEEVAVVGLEEEGFSRLKDLGNKDTLRRRTILPWDKALEATDGTREEEEEGMQGISEIFQDETLRIITVDKDRDIGCLDSKRPLVQRREGTVQPLYRTIKPPPHKHKHWPRRDSVPHRRLPLQPTVSRLGLGDRISLLFP